MKQYNNTNTFKPKSIWDFASLDDDIPNVDTSTITNTNANISINISANTNTKSSYDASGEYHNIRNEAAATLSLAKNFFAETLKKNNPTSVSVELPKECPRSGEETTAQTDSGESPIAASITINETNGIKKEMLLTCEEFLVMEVAVLHNNGVVNLMNRDKAIKNLINKGLLHISSGGGFIVTNRIVDIIIYSERTHGSIDLNTKLKKEMSKHNKSNRALSGVEWRRVVA